MNRTRYGLIFVCLSILFVGACTSQPADESMVYPTATLNSIFAMTTPQVAMPTPVVTRSLSVAREAQRDVQIYATPLPQVGLPPVMNIFQESLSPDWSLENSAAAYDDNYDRIVLTGGHSIVFTPTLGARTLFFTVPESSQRVFRSADVLGIAFSIYSEKEYIGLEDIAMTVIGSDELPYFDPDDRSVINTINPNPDWKPEDDEISNRYALDYSETLLGFLGINKDIPPGEWVWVTNWTQQLIYDPETKFLTGFYIKVEKGFETPIVIDDITMMVQNEITRTRNYEPQTDRQRAERNDISADIVGLRRR